MQELEEHVRGRRSCPRCGDEMWIVERRGQKLDLCKRCKGLWFDPSELDSVLGSERRIELMLRIKPSVRGERLHCPNCMAYMESKDIFGVLIDHCSECKGFWLDSGETEKLWKITEHVMHPFEENDSMDPAVFWYPFTGTKE